MPLFFCFRLITFFTLYCVSIFVQAGEPEINDFYARMPVHVGTNGGGETFEVKDGADLGGHRQFWGESFSRQYGQFRDIKFDKADLSYAIFFETMYIRCSFRNTRMVGVDATGSQFIDCDFTGANIEGAIFTQLSARNLAQTNNYAVRDLSNIKIVVWGPWSDPDNVLGAHGVLLPRGDWSDPDPNDIQFDFSKCNLENTYLPYNLKYCDFTDARINGARIGSEVLKDGTRSFTMNQLKSTRNYKDKTFINVTFVGLDFSGENFSQINFTGCRFPYAAIHFLGGGVAFKSHLNDTNLTDAIISACDFSEVEGLTLAQIKSTWNYKTGNMAGIKLPKEIQAALDAEQKAKKPQ